MSSRIPSVTRVAAAATIVLLVSALVPAVAQRAGGTFRVYNSTQPPSASIHGRIDDCHQHALHGVNNLGSKRAAELAGDGCATNSPASGKRGGALMGGRSDLGEPSTAGFMRGFG